MKRGIALRLVLLVVGLLPVAAHAAPILTLFSTGVSPAGLALADFDPDPHYTLTSSPGGFYAAGPATTVASAELPPAWVANTATSRWINPTGLGADMVDWHLGGVYVYETTFSLAGFVPSTTTISLGWAVDDNDPGAAIGPYDYIALNGIPLVFTGTGGPPGSYAGFHPEILGPALPWLPGLNTLEFVVANTDSDPGPSLTGPTGIHVFIASADAALIPEPSSWVTLIIGLAGMVCFARRRCR
jgi:hypothetical protein